MDDRRFDDLTKLVGRRASRRAVMKAAIAGALASVFGGGIAEAALSPIKTRPKLCIQPGQPCARPGTDPSRDCCYKCNSSTHTCCEDINYVCTKDSDCCVTASGVQPICRDTNSKDSDKRKTCQLPGTLTPGAQCVSGSDCASGNCSGGVCQQCAVGNTACGANCCNTAQCQTCVNGVCKSKCGPCQSCDGKGNCSSTCTKCQTCTNGACKDKTCPPCQTCNPETGLCATTCDACHVCKNGQCAPKCNACQTCNPQTGVCTNNTCVNTCDVCDPATGQCKPKVCGQCQTCDPDDGVCKTNCNKCEVCRNNVCVASVDCSSQTIGCLGKLCDPATGLCTIDNPLSGVPCADGNGCTLNDTCVNGVCVGTAVQCPSGCEACRSTGPDSYVCESACLECEECDPYDDMCVPVDCSALDDGECIVGECRSGTCIEVPYGSDTTCTDAAGNDATCCAGECCPEECFCLNGIFCAASGVAVCFSDSQCPPGMFCNAQNFCDALSCVMSVCPPGSRCFGSFCFPLCNHCLTTGCDDCEVCNVTTGQCQPCSVPEFGAEACVDGVCGFTCVHGMVNDGEGNCICEAECNAASDRCFVEMLTTEGCTVCTSELPICDYPTCASSADCAPNEACLVVLLGNSCGVPGANGVCTPLCEDD